MERSARFDPEVEQAFTRIRERLRQIGRGRHARVEITHFGPTNVSGRYVRDEPLPPLPPLRLAATGG